MKESAEVINFKKQHETLVKEIKDFELRAKSESLASIKDEVSLKLNQYTYKVDLTTIGAFLKIAPKPSFYSDQEWKHCILSVLYGDETPSDAKQFNILYQRHFSNPKFPEGYGSLLPLTTAYSAAGANANAAAGANANAAAGAGANAAAGAGAGSSSPNATNPPNPSKTKMDKP